MGVPTRRAETPVPTQPSEASAKVRRLVPSGVPAERAPILVAAAASDAHAKEDATKLSKLDQLFHLVLDNVLNLEELGVTAAQLQDPMELQRLKDTTMAVASRLSSQRLGALASALRRWLRFCATIDSRPPCSWLISSGRYQLGAPRRRPACMPA